MAHNDVAALEEAVTEETAAVIVEGIQGVGGIQVASEAFLQTARRLCDEYGACLILDSVQCGYGRSGKFFSHQHYDVRPDLITVAKGMGNGFPVGGVLISPLFEASFGLLGTTFGGNHLACAAALAVLEVMEQERLMENAARVGGHLQNGLAGLPGIREVRGRGLMIGIEFEQPVAAIRDTLLFDHHMFCGYAGKHTLRLLPSLALTLAEADEFLSALQQVLRNQQA